MNNPTISKYLKQKRPSFTIIEHLLLQTIKININPNNINKLIDNLNIADTPIHYKLKYLKKLRLTTFALLRATYELIKILNKCFPLIKKIEDD